MSWLNGLLSGKKPFAKPKSLAPSWLQLDGLDIEVTRKPIKHLHLRLQPPIGKVQVSAPMHLTDAQIKCSLQPRLDWIRAKQAAFAQRPVVQEKMWISGELHAYLGKTYRLVVVESERRRSSVTMDEAQQQLVMQVPRGASSEYKAKVMAHFYRATLKQYIPELLAKWQPMMGVEALDWGVKDMRTRWGTCNTRDKRVWLSLMLAKMPVECIEYVMVHELVHLLERNHTPRFHALMTQFLPNWPALQQQLNQSARNELSL
ncbi:MAG TPA: SprT family zinc-dependent metalloprotease [Thiotrichales bacterium]|nr:SprT family zinc-dependent metalloprotease [Thiotrichales bacterium]